VRVQLRVCPPQQSARVRKKRIERHFNKLHQGYGGVNSIRGV
jgi:hypothetical protein